MDAITTAASDAGLLVARMEDADSLAAVSKDVVQSEASMVATPMEEAASTGDGGNGRRFLCLCDEIKEKGAAPAAPHKTEFEYSPQRHRVTEKTRTGKTQIGVLCDSVVNTIISALPCKKTRRNQRLETQQAASLHYVPVPSLRSF